MLGIEFVLIDAGCSLETFRKELRWNEIYYHISNGII